MKSIQLLKKIIKGKSEKKQFDSYYASYKKSSFEDCHCTMEKQFEASITRLYHTIEKGLAYLDYRPGFGKDNVDRLIISMEQYSKQYDVNKFFYQTALSTLFEYVRKNTEYGYEDKALESRIASLPGEANEYGGTLRFTLPDTTKLNFEELIKSRHSVRHFSDKPLNVGDVKDAIALAQYTPSACNRQGWKCYIIQDKKKIEELLKYQNGNRGFGHEFDQLILVTGDLKAFNRSREVFQVFIDAGMYAMRVLDCFYYKGIASCPLSASLTPEQEKNARKILGLDDAEVFIMYIGIGNHPEGENQTTRSERHEPYTVVI